MNSASHSISDSVSELKALRRSHRRQGVSKLLLNSGSWLWMLAELFWAGFGFLMGAMQGPHWKLPQAQTETYITVGVFSICVCIAGLGVGLFDREARLSRVHAIRSLLITVFVALAASLTLVHFVFFLQPGRYVLIYGAVGAVGFLSVWHLFVNWLVAKFPQKHIFIGKAGGITGLLKKEVLRISQDNNVSSSLLKVERRVEESFDAEDWNPSVSLRPILEAGVSDLVVTRDGFSESKITQLCVQAMNFGIRVVDEPELYAELLKKYPVAYLDIRWALSAGFDTHRTLTNYLKRSFDIFFSMFWLLALSPVLLLIALFVWVSSPGSILHIQERRGRYFKSFRMYKFRSMKIDVEGEHHTDKKDPRITWIGALLRPLHLDELPQLWNILRGDMSFVGPRPAIFETIEGLRNELPIYDLRHVLRPGLTGLAQITQGHTGDSLEEIQEKLGFDLYYIRHYGISMDIWIVLRTVFTLSKKAW